MSDYQADLLDKLREFKEQLPPDDERMLVINQLIDDRTAASTADGTVAQAPADILPFQAQTLESPGSATASEVVAPAAPSWLPTPDQRAIAPRPSTLQRYPTGAVEFYITPGRGFGLAPIFGLVTVLAVGATLAVLFLAGSISQRSGAQTVPAAQPVPSPAFYLSKGLPDPAITPGKFGENAAEPQAVTEETRRRVFAAYGLDPSDRKYVIGFLVPASLGGTNDPANLFPLTRWFSDLKFRCDKRLTELTANRSITVQQARNELTTNWVSAMHTHYVRNYGASNEVAARKEEEVRAW